MLNQLDTTHASPPRVRPRTVVGSADCVGGGAALAGCHEITKPFLHWCWVSPSTSALCGAFRIPRHAATDKRHSSTNVQSASGRLACGCVASRRVRATACNVRGEYLRHTHSLHFRIYFFVVLSIPAIPYNGVIWFQPLPTTLLHNNLQSRAGIT